MLLPTHLLLVSLDLVALKFEAAGPVSISPSRLMLTLELLGHAL